MSNKIGFSSKDGMSFVFRDKIQKVTMELAQGRPLRYELKAWFNKREFFSIGCFRSETAAQRFAKSCGFEANSIVDMTGGIG